MADSRSKRFLILFTSTGLFALIVVLTAGQGAAPKPTTDPATSTKAASSTTKSSAAASAPKAAAPASIPDLLATAIKLFDGANSSDWTDAAKQSVAIKEEMKRLKTDLPKPNTAQQSRLKEITTHIVAIDAAIKAQKRQSAMMETNRLIRVAGVLADTFINPVPQSVWQMEYLAREMQVWSADPADLSKLNSLLPRIEIEWAKVGKAVTAKAGQALTKEFIDALTKAKTAITADDFAKQSKPLLEALSKTEKAFGK